MATPASSLVLSLGAILLGMAVLLTGHGLMTILVPVQAVALGWSDTAIGLLGSLYYLGFSLGCVAVPRILLVAGHIRTFAALIAIAVVGVLALPILPEIVLWGLSRFATGFAMAGLFLIAESWLNERAPTEARGTVIAAYVGIVFGAIALGQLLSTPAGGGPSAFSLGAMLLVLAILPVALTRSEQPAPVAVTRFEPRRLFRLSPVAFVGVFTNGAMMGTFYALAPTYALARGLDASLVPVFTGVALAAGGLAQLPMGRLSDRMDRRRVLIGLAMSTAAVCLFLASRPDSAFWLIAASAVFGIAVTPGYAVSAAHAFDHAPYDRFVQVSAGLLLANGIGAMVAPLVAGAAMEALGSGAVFGVTGFVSLAFALFTLYRMGARAPVSDPDAFSLGVSGQVAAVAPPEPIEESRYVERVEVSTGVIEAWSDVRGSEAKEGEANEGERPRG